MTHILDVITLGYMKIETGSMSQGIQEPPEAGKRQGNMILS